MINIMKTLKNVNTIFPTKLSSVRVMNVVEEVNERAQDIVIRKLKEELNVDVYPGEIDIVQHVWPRSTKQQQCKKKKNHTSTSAMLAAPYFVSPTTWTREFFF